MYFLSVPLLSLLLQRLILIVLLRFGAPQCERTRHAST